MTSGPDSSSEIATDRLRLIPVTAESAAIVSDPVRRTHEIVCAAGFPEEGDLVIAGLCSSSEPPPGGGFVGARWILLTDGQYVGSAGFVGPPDEAGAAEIGYGLARGARGCGYATEAVAGLLAWGAAHGVATAYAHVLESNEASQNVLRRSGFRRVKADASTPDGHERWEALLR